MIFPIKNGIYSWFSPLKMVIFHSYVKLPGGIWSAGTSLATGVTSSSVCGSASTVSATFRDSTRLPHQAVHHDEPNLDPKLIRTSQDMSLKQDQNPLQRTCGYLWSTPEILWSTPRQLDPGLRNFTNPSPSLGCSRDFHHFQSCCFLAPNPRWEVGKPHTFDMLHKKSVKPMVSCSWSPNHPTPNYIKSGSACFGGNAFLVPFFFCFGPIISSQSSKCQSAGEIVKCGKNQATSHNFKGRNQTYVMRKLLITCKIIWYHMTIYIL